MGHGATDAVLGPGERTSNTQPEIPSPTPFPVLASPVTAQGLWLDSWHFPGPKPVLPGLSQTRPRAGLGQLPALLRRQHSPWNEVQTP